ncbi:molybdopterin-binding domain nicotinamide nucleotide amidohydrolase, putative [Citrifermentans bemidjiense Bem]|uniref:CinA-like protein n=1 Tax=Citrifermentans bemidjiense (strain ATCC BAA-1014 / DSM 16622 / JCM 12645 / Bem) TaxID=404380 RepID=CINAL_CITBB|nr:competence/damage-inducible protein A [Citrifermentans bemidjiense]B5ED03.1 RecName: Full=CinA-like protein [Citrifermentans bemidjiense Bem]ACH40620.1 molybdopterin-binding domain nicotinamide nucleotide amidohydrolase, putative [Citrifermentans bemidjiense Bem]
MRVAVLSIGDELLSGEVVDTNASHIADRLFQAGGRVERHLTVPDDAEAIASALTELGARSDAVIVTGGLGPTPDDLTAEAAARAAGTELELSSEALDHLERFAQRITGELHPANRRQALLPKGCRLIPNPLGTALGFVVRIGQADCFFMPGVPYEMERMLEETVLPELTGRFEAGWQRVTLKLFGIAEAAIAELLEGAIPEGSPVQLAYCVKFPEIHLILRATASDAPFLQQAAGELRQRLSAYLFAEDREEMDDRLALLLRESGLTLALAESCTGGMIAARITAVAGSSAYFLEGNVTYSNEAKTRMLQVPAPLIAEHGAVSAEVARAMAVGAREAAGSDLALSVTGIAGPDGGTPEKPVGTVYLALVDQGSCRVERFNFQGDRDRVRSITCFTALDWLRRYLLTRKTTPGRG